MKFLLLFCLALFLHASSYTTQTSRTFIGLGFGEIPILAQSAKYAISVGRYLSEDFSFLGVIQSKDTLQRNGESFNAQNSGLDGLSSSTETTGERLLAAIVYEPQWSYVHFIAGVLYNGSDTEQMRFSSQQTIDIEVTRTHRTVPVIGIGYAHDITRQWFFHTSMTAGIFSGISEPDVSVKTSEPIDQITREKITSQVIDGYMDNFHNHYHIFNIGIAYRF